MIYIYMANRGIALHQVFCLVRQYQTRVPGILTRTQTALASSRRC